MVAGYRRIHFMSLRYTLNDSYRWLFALAVWGIGVAIYFLSDSKAAPDIAMGFVAGTLPALWYGMPCKMELADRHEVICVESYLESRNFICNDGIWSPRLPRMLYFNSQRLEISDGHIFGPMLVLTRIRKLIDM